MKKETYSVQTYVTPAMKHTMERLTQRTGMTQSECLTRVFKWLVSQDEVVQMWALGLLPDQLRDQAAQHIAASVTEKEPTKRAV